MHILYEVNFEHCTCNSTYLTLATRRKAINFTTKDAPAINHYQNYKLIKTHQVMSKDI